MILGNDFLTMSDVAKSRYADMGAVVLTMAESNSMFGDCMYTPKNKGAVHVTHYQGTLPMVWYRKANEAIPSGKAVLSQRTWTTSRFEHKSQIDEMVAENGGMEKLAFNRWYQGKSHMEAASQELADLFLRGTPSTVDPKAPGFYDHVTVTSTDELSKQTINFGGTGSDTARILFVNWGPAAIHGIYDKTADMGGMGGITVKDKTPGPANKIKFNAKTEDGEVGEIFGYEEQFIANHGLVIVDQRQMSALVNIPTDTILTAPASGISGNRVLNILDGMIQMNHKVHNPNNGMGAYYLNRTLFMTLHRAALEKVTIGGGLNFTNFGGKRLLTFLGHPLRLQDAMLDTEQAVA